MLFDSTHCDQCEHEYDSTLSRCPKCKTANKNRATLKYKNKVAFIPIVHQFMCLLIGLAGLYLFNYIIGIACYSMYETEALKYRAIVTYSSYALVFVCLGALLFAYFGELASHFKKVRPYVAGLIYGAILIVFAILYSLMMSKLYPTELSENEKIARQLTISYPYLSIIILCFIGPICEEITYRLGLFSLCSRVNRYFAYIITIVLFTCIHINFTAKDIYAELVSLPIYAFSGFVLCFSYEHEGPACSITAHIVNNLYSVIGVLVANAISK